MSAESSTAAFTYRVLLFGSEAAACGKSEVLVHGDDPAITVAELKTRLARAEPNLNLSFRAARIAVNHSFVTEATMVRPQDEVALIGIVSGG